MESQSIRSALRLAVVPFLAVAFCCAPRGPVAKGPIIQAIEPDRAVVVIETEKEHRVVIEYGTSPDYGSLALRQESSPGKKGAPGLRVHHIRLNALLPGTEYRYRALIRDLDGETIVKTEERRFTTAPSPGALNKTRPLRFVVYGDTRAGRFKKNLVHRWLLLLIRKKEPEFLLHTGDLVFQAIEERSWDAFFRLVDPLGLPMIVAAGNHDFGEEGERLSRYFIPTAGGSREGFYYSFDWGAAHFLVLNTEASLDPDSDQIHFAASDLEKTAGRGPLFVIHHRPLYASTRAYVSRPAGKALASLYSRFGVDVVFSGHNHNYERTRPIDGVTYIVTGGGGARLDRIDRPGSFSASLVVDYHYVVVDVEAGMIRLEMRDLRDKVRDRIEIDAAANG